MDNMTISKRSVLGSLIVISLAIMAVTPAGALADDTANALSAQERQAADQINQIFRHAVDVVQSAVVHLSVKKAIDDNPYMRIPGGGDDNHAEGLGSGCIIDKRGYIITNNHVVADTDKVEVILADGRHFIAQEIMLDPDTDLAIVKIDPAGSDLPVAQFGDSDQAQEQVAFV